MKTLISASLLFTASFAIGWVAAPLFEVEPKQVSKPVPEQKPVKHYKNRYGEDIRQIV